MKKVIKSFSSLSPSLQDEVYMDYWDGVLERTYLTYKGKSTEGVLFNTPEITYLIPVSTILSEQPKDLKELDDDDDYDGENNSDDGLIDFENEG